MNQLTIGMIAAETGRPVHAIRYALEKYNVQPVGRLGLTRVWSRDQMPEIRSLLERTAETTRRRGNSLAAAASTCA